MSILLFFRGGGFPPPPLFCQLLNQEKNGSDEV
nr:MAG TPA: hypothetical protein [Caudoviricetes sp.]